MKKVTLSGIWAVPNYSYPDREDIVVFNEALSRIIVFTTFELDPLKRFPMKLWVEVDSHQIRTKVMPHATKSNVTAYLLEGDKLTMTTNGTKQTCRRLFPVEIPNWLQTELSAAYAAMDLKEK